MQIRNYSLSQPAVSQNNDSSDVEKLQVAIAIEKHLSSESAKDCFNDFDWNSQTWDKVIAKLVPLIKNASTNWEDRHCTPQEEAAVIRNLFQEELPSTGINLDAVIERLKSVVDYSGYNGHPRWFGYITSAPDPIGVIASFFTAAINQNNNLWRISPAATSIELQCIQWFAEMFGLSGEWEGTFSSGGQFANIIAHATARTAKCPWDVRKYGVAGPAGSGKLKVYVGDQVHYCHQQAVELLGLGTEALRTVPTDDEYRMRVDLLAQMIAEDKKRGDIPIAVVATAGTVAVGAIDPIAQLRELTTNEGVWLHVDGAYGLPALMLENPPQDLIAARTADSLAFDPHKWLYSPIDAGVTLVRHQGALGNTFGMKISYLDQQATATADLVNFTPENSRPARAIKVWLALLARGVEGFKTAIDRDIALTQRMAEIIAATEDLVLAVPTSLSIVCWRVEPVSLQNNPTALNELQLQVVAELERRGIALISKAQLNDGRITLRACIVNFRTQEADVIATVEATAKIGRELAIAK